VRRLVLVVGLAVAAGACSGDDGGGGASPSSSTTAAPTTTTTAPAPGEVPVVMEPAGEASLGSTSAPAEGVPEVLPDGVWFGYLADVDLGRRVLVFDLAQWFIGDDAEAAAREDGAVADDESVSNDYYVRNTTTATPEVPFAEGVAVTVARCPGSCGQFVGDVEGLAASFDGGGPFDLADAYRGAQSQYWLTVEGGAATSIDEQYVP